MIIDQLEEQENRVSSNPPLGGGEEGERARRRSCCGSRTRRKRKKRDTLAERSPCTAMSQGESCSNKMESPLRSLHSCSQPWKIGVKNAQVQLTTASPSEAHHRAIMAILNRITDTKIPVLVQRASDMLFPSQLKEGGPSLATIRKDFIFMLLEKAQDEELYCRDYCTFIRCLCSNLSHKKNLLENTDHAKILSEQINLEEILRTDCTNRFDVQLETLRKMYANELPWNEMGDRHGRRRLATHLSLMVMLHMRNILPFEDLNRILSILARPLLAQVEPGNQNEGGNEQENMENIFNDLNIDGDGGSNARVSGITVEALYSEILAKFIFNLGHFNLVENNEVRQQAETLCSVLQNRLRSLSSRQMFVVMRTLDLRDQGWRELIAPHRFG